MRWEAHNFPGVTGSRTWNRRRKNSCLDDPYGDAAAQASYPNFGISEFDSPIRPCVRDRFVAEFRFANCQISRLSSLSC